ncbi:MAG TPA: PRC-barrel domain-containing protein [Allosphingosinicella sp.]
MSSKKVEGTPVIGSNGETLGRIESFMVDKYTGRVAYAIMTFGGTMGVGTSYFPLPWPLLDYDVQKDGYALDITKEQLANAPKFEATKEPEFSPEYRRQILVHYRP